VAVETRYTSGAYWADRLNSDSTYKVRLLLSLLEAAQIQICDGARLVEVGCGQGAFLIPLAQQLRARNIHAEYTGIDISPDAIALAKSRAKNIHWQVGSTEVVDQADIVFLMDVVEHVENPDLFLRSLVGKTSLVVLHLPIEQSLAHFLLRKATASAREFDHLHFYSAETASLLIKRSPFLPIARQVSAAQWESVRVVLGKAKVPQAVRVGLYRMAPRLAEMIAGGTTMWVLRDPVGVDTAAWAST
jgi:2-polyprenyl-3-methyl-5-hydroxy-6-metoxy-1,4-benzoquinol methylase